MSSYKYKIKVDKNGYFFGLYPNNSNTQAIGVSPNYPSISLCNQALVEFRTFVNNHQLSTEKHPYVLIEKQKGKYYFKYYNDTDLVFFRLKGYDKIDECRKGIHRIWMNIKAPLKS